MAADKSKGCAETSFSTFSLRMCRLQRFSGVAASGIRPATWPFRNSRVDRRHQHVLLAASGVQWKRAVDEASFFILHRHCGENTRKTIPLESFHFDRIVPNCQANVFSFPQFDGNAILAIIRYTPPTWRHAAALRKPQVILQQRLCADAALLTSSGLKQIRTLCAALSGTWEPQRNRVPAGRAAPAGIPRLRQFRRGGHHARRRIRRGQDCRPNRPARIPLGGASRFSDRSASAILVGPRTEPPATSMLTPI